MYSGLWAGKPSRAVAVGHPANFAACSKDAVCFFPSAVLPVASIFSMLADRPPLGVQGVGHPLMADGSEEGALPDVRGADARRREIARPNGVTCGFQPV